MDLSRKTKVRERVWKKEGGVQEPSRGENWNRSEKKGTLEIKTTQDERRSRKLKERKVGVKWGGGGGETG